MRRYLFPSNRASERPLIGVVTHDAGDEPIFSNFISWIKAAGGVPVGIPLLAEDSVLETQFQACHAVIFDGGPDVNPEFYGQDVIETCNVLAMPPFVDSLELALMRRCIAARIPLLAICRGAQLLNVACGGTLWQDVNHQGVTDLPHQGRDHLITVDQKSTLGRITGQRTVQVNSLHHQAIRRVGVGLRVVARAELVEAIELEQYPFGLGVQFHPELMFTEKQPWPQLMMDQLVSNAAKFRRPLEGTGMLAGVKIETPPENPLPTLPIPALPIPKPPSPPRRLPQVNATRTETSGGVSWQFSSRPQVQPGGDRQVT